MKSYILLAVGSILAIACANHGFQGVGIVMFVGFAVCSMFSRVADFLTDGDENEDHDDLLTKQRQDLDDLRARFASIDSTATKMIVDVRKDITNLRLQVTYLESKLDKNDPFGG